MLPVIFLCALSAHPVLPPLTESVFAYMFSPHLFLSRVAVSPGSDMPPIYIPPLSLGHAMSGRHINDKSKMLCNAK